VIGFALPSADTSAGRFLRFPLKLVSPTWTVRILRGPLRGKRWIAGSQRHAFWFGSYERHIQECMVREVRAGGVFFDIGANVGFYSLLSSFLVEPGKVFAFEPLPRNTAYFKKHVALNQRENIELLELALSDWNGKSQFELEKTGAMGKIHSGGSLSVDVVTLDALLQAQRVAPPNYMKMDIEGEEFKALLGAKVCFERYHPKLFLATHGREVHKQCCQVLTSWNYDLHVIAQESEDRAEILALPNPPKK